MARFPDGSATRTLPPLTKDEFDAVIAGLNLLYNCRDGDGLPTEDIASLPTDGGTHAPISQSDLDRLIVMINEGDVGAVPFSEED